MHPLSASGQGTLNKQRIWIGRQRLSLLLLTKNMGSTGRQRLYTSNTTMYCEYMCYFLIQHN